MTFIETITFAFPQFDNGNTRTVRFLEKGTPVKKLIELKKKKKWQNDKAMKCDTTSSEASFYSVRFPRKMTKQISRFSENVSRRIASVFKFVLTLLRKPRYTGIKVSDRFYV